jgi:hypothetical protein
MRQVADGLGKTLAPFCEVVLHDLTEPEHAILGDPQQSVRPQRRRACHRIGPGARPPIRTFDQVIANYPNTFPDGRLAKSTSIGIKDSEGQYIAALCMNVDLTVFRSLNTMLTQFGNVDAEAGARKPCSLPAPTPSACASTNSPRAGHDAARAQGRRAQGR